MRLRSPSAPDTVATDARAVSGGSAADRRGLCSLRQLQGSGNIVDPPGGRRRAPPVAPRGDTVQDGLFGARGHARRGGRQSTRPLLVGQDYRVAGSVVSRAAGCRWALPLGVAHEFVRLRRSSPHTGWRRLQAEQVGSGLGRSWLAEQIKAWRTTPATVASRSGRVSSSRRNSARPGESRMAFYFSRWRARARRRPGPAWTPDTQPEGSEYGTGPSGRRDGR